MHMKINYKWMINLNEHTIINKIGITHINFLLNLSYCIFQIFLIGLRLKSV